MYCSWKNNHLLDSSLNGLRDFDLLVDIDQLLAFESVLREHGFVEFLTPRQTSRCIRHYYKLEPEDGVFMHIHAYFRVITGESLFKNYHLPFDNQILDSSFRNPQGIYECNAHHQLQLYAIRQLLKCSSLPSLLMVLRDRKDYNEELGYIRSAVDSGHDAPVRNFGLDSVEMLDKPLTSRWFVGLKLRHQFKAYRLKSGISAFTGSYAGLMELMLRRFFRAKGKRCNGMIVALVGLDGSGKSSSVDDLTEVFGSILHVRKLHFGRPPATLMTFPNVIPLKLYQILKKQRGLGIENGNSQKNTGIVHAIRLLAIAHDRYHLMLKANRLRAKGILVVMDRCPIATIGCMDAPKIVYEGNSIILKKLMQVERDYYTKMAVVDHAIFMKTTLNSAIERNNSREKSNKETDDEIRERFQQNAQVEFVAGKNHTIDTEKALSAVRVEVRKRVWELIVASN